MKLTHAEAESHPLYAAGEAYFRVGEHPDCNHAAEDGCMWCCRYCNVDRHVCPGCGTITDHKGSPCPDCLSQYAAEEASGG